jgi:hypothetical protein
MCGSSRLLAAMDTAAKCYEMAERYEQEAARAGSDQSREILLEVAANWRELADEIEARATPGHSPARRH